MQPPSSRVAPQQHQHGVTVWPSNVTPRSVPRRAENRYSDKVTSTCRPCSISHLVKWGKQPKGPLDEYNRMSLSRGKERGTDTCYTEGSGKIRLRARSQAQRAYTAQVHLYKIPRISESRERKSRLAAARDSGGSGSQEVTTE